MAALRTLLPMRSFASTSTPLVTRPMGLQQQQTRLFTSTRLLTASHPKAAASQSYIKGTVNEPTTYPPPSPSHGHYHWMFERGVSVALLPLTAIAFAKHGGSGLLDAGLGLSLVLHSHMGE